MIQIRTKLNENLNFNNGCVNKISCDKTSFANMINLSNANSGEKLVVF